MGILVIEVSVLAGYGLCLASAACGRRDRRKRIDMNPAGGVRRIWGIRAPQAPEVREAIPLVDDFWGIRENGVRSRASGHRGAIGAPPLTRHCAFWTSSCRLRASRQTSTVS